MLKIKILQAIDKNKSQKMKNLGFHILKKRTFAAQKFESKWQNKTQNKETRGSKT